VKIVPDHVYNESAMMLALATRQRALAADVQRFIREKLGDKA
jgi:hypothetical protein